MEYFLFSIILILFFYLYREINREKQKNEILQAFIAGFIRASSDYYNPIIEDESYKNQFRATKIPLNYEDILDNICFEFQKNYYVNGILSKNKRYEKFKKNARYLFDNKKSDERGFKQIYLDFCDKYSKDWLK